MTGDVWTIDDWKQYAATGKEPNGASTGVFKKKKPANALSLSESEKKASTASGYATKCTVDGIKFDSILESKVYLRLKAQKQRGEIRGFIRQVSFPFSSGIRYRADFMAWPLEGPAYIVEAKGHERDRWKMIKRMLVDEYPFVPVLVITKDGEYKL